MSFQFRHLHINCYSDTFLLSCFISLLGCSTRINMCNLHKKTDACGENNLLNEWFFWKEQALGGEVESFARCELILEYNFPFIFFSLLFGLFFFFLSSGTNISNIALLALHWRIFVFRKKSENCIRTYVMLLWDDSIVQYRRQTPICFTDTGFYLHWCWLSRIPQWKMHRALKSSRNSAVSQKGQVRLNRAWNLQIK